MKELIQKFRNKTFNQKTFFILKNIILLFLPLIIEFLVYKNYSFIINKTSLIRVGYMYGLLLMYYIYKLINIYTDKVRKVLDFIFKYRYAIAAVTFLVMVAFKLNFSNIGCWQNYIPSENTTILGANKAIRSDEWKVQIPFFFAQNMNTEEYYPLNNQNIGEGQNMLMVYPAPAFDITLIGKPQNWGFFILGRDYGFSWYSCIRVIALILLSVEICMILTKKDKLLSIIGGLWIAFSPTILWWFSSIGDIFIHAFAIIVLFHYYVTNTDCKIWKKILMALGVISSISGFVFCFYPPVQIPIAYVILVFLLVDYIINFKNIKLKDYVIMIITLLISLIIVGYYLVISLDDISLIMNTVYPGSRNLTGGDYRIKHSIEYFFDFFTPFSNSGLIEVGENQSEAAASIFPIIALFIGIVYSLKNIKEKIKDKENWLFYGLVIVFIIFILWMYLGFGKILSKITLFFLCQPERVALIFGLVGTLLTLMLFGRKEFKLEKIQSVIICLIIVLISNTIISSVGYSQYFDVTKKLILYTAIFLMSYTVLTNNKRAFSCIIFAITIATGITINPVNIGTDAIFNTQTAKEIQSIVNKDNESIWVGYSSMDAQYLIANGAKVLNGVNYYPNFKLLNSLDESGKYNEIYNRYAHIEFNLSTEDETEFELIQADMYTINISKDDFEKLGIKYYYSSVLLEDELVDTFDLNLIYSNEQEGKWIYEH